MGRALLRNKPLKSAEDLASFRAGLGTMPPHPHPQPLRCPLGHHEAKAVLRVKQDPKVTLGQPSETVSVTSAGQRRVFSRQTIRRITV